MKRIVIALTFAFAGVACGDNSDAEDCAIGSSGKPSTVAQCECLGMLAVINPGSGAECPAGYTEVSQLPNPGEWDVCCEADAP